MIFKSTIIFFICFSVSAWADDGLIPSEDRDLSALVSQWEDLQADQQRAIEQASRAERIVRSQTDHFFQTRLQPVMQDLTSKPGLESLRENLKRAEVDTPLGRLTYEQVLLLQDARLVLQNDLESIVSTQNSTSLTRRISIAESVDEYLRAAEGLSSRDRDQINMAKQNIVSHLERNSIDPTDDLLGSWDQTVRRVQQLEVELERLRPLGDFLLPIEGLTPQELSRVLRGRAEGLASRVDLDSGLQVKKLIEQLGLQDVFIGQNLTEWERKVHHLNQGVQQMDQHARDLIARFHQSTQKSLGEQTESLIRGAARVTRAQATRTQKTLQNAFWKRGLATGIATGGALAFAGGTLYHFNDYLKAKKGENVKSDSVPLPKAQGAR